MKTNILNILLLILIVLTAFLTIVGIVKKKNADEIIAEKPVLYVDEDERYHVNGRTIVEFSDVICEQFSKESELVVSSVEASCETRVKQTGAFDLDVLNKYQTFIYKTTGRFSVDLSEMSEQSISLDEEKKKITIAIPHAKMMPVDIDPSKFVAKDTQSGFLAFGSLKFTANEYNNIEIECKKKLEEGINTKENRLMADENAIEEIKRIYEPIVKAVDDEYSVEVAFTKTLNPVE